MRLRELIKEYKDIEKLDVEKEVGDDAAKDETPPEKEQTATPPSKPDKQPAAKVQPQKVKTPKVKTPSKKKAAPMVDRKAILAKAKAMGFDTILYHASTHDISEFDSSSSNPDNDWGPGVYATNSLEDANTNYAGEGPDLTHRIEVAAYNIMSQIQLEFDGDDEALEEYLGQYGYTLDDYERLGHDIATEIARKQLKGGSEGVVYPIMINRSGMAVIAGGDSTILPGPSLDDFIEIARSEINQGDYSDENEYEDAVMDRAYELQNEDEDTPYAKVLNVLRSLEVDDDTIGEIMDRADAYDGVVNLGYLDDAIRNSQFEIYANDGEYMLTGGAVTALVLQELGYPGVIDRTVNKRFGAGRKYGRPMPGVTSTTEHTIVFPGNEHLIRSVNAMFHPEKTSSRNILDSDDSDDKEVNTDPNTDQICEYDEDGDFAAALDTLSPTQRQFAEPDEDAVVHETILRIKKLAGIK